MNLERLKYEYLDYSKHFKSPGTYRYDRSHLNTIVNFLIKEGFKDSDELTYSSLYDFIDYSRKQENTNKTINKRIALLNRAIAFQVKQERCNPSMISSFPQLKEIDKRFNVVKENDMKKIINYLMNLDDSFMNLRNKIIFFIFIDTGMRLSELANVKTDNIDLSTDSILLSETKTKRERVVYISDITSSYLKKYISMIDNKSSYLLRSVQYKDQAISYVGIIKVMHKVRDILGLRSLSSHMIRHAYGTLAYKLNISTLFTKNTMGHARVEMTERYTHYDIETNKKHYKNFSPMTYYLGKKDE